MVLFILDFGIKKKGKVEESNIGLMDLIMKVIGKIIMLQEEVD